ncbi:capsule assembly Wzi family protein [Ignavibacterium album]|uniref:capsule assembly Wzi family protein n=1 Tax=Ignavibacterium album TaxID=591197 RepID=UPI0026EE505A|nr:capsule assembly Wzi family protein [Ignavibacterium album]
MRNVFTKVFFFLAFYSLSFSQVVYEPLGSDVYSFLNRLSQKGIIELDDQIRPLSRKYIAGKLLSVKQLSEKLTSLETEELNFYLTDFGRELDLLNNVKVEKEKISSINKDQFGRYRLFSYRDNIFTINLSPILGAEIGSRDNERLIHIWNGISFYGYLSDNIGFNFRFIDNTEKGNNIDKWRLFTPKTGFHVRNDETIFGFPPDKIEYSEVNTNIGVDWSWGKFSVGKDFMEWGYGESGLLVLSQKAPSFPFIRLDINPVDWLSFNYFHGFLASDVVDSNETYYHETGGERIVYREKFIASHTLSVKPTKGLTLSLGESIVYADKFEFSYLFPLMFFRVNDHHLSRQINEAGSNSQFFFSVSSRNHLKNTHLYSSLFIDELTITNIFDKEKQRNQFGYSLGASFTDLLFENLTFTLEFTRIFPFVYEHYIQTTTYQNASYNLGHWMGSNGDLIYGSVNYRFLRGLQATLWAQYIRKGDKGNAYLQYQTQPQPPFLFGLRKNYTYFGGFVKYEILHELFVKFSFQLMKISEQQEDLNYRNSNLNEFYFSIYYGI